MKKIKQPLVSIIIPCYQPKAIRNILETIKKQSYQNIEVICVDAITRPDKKIKPIVEQYGQYFVYGPERSNQRNFGAKKANGKYFLFLDQDTIPSREVVKECVQKINKKCMIIIPEISFGKGFWSKVKSFERSMYFGGDVAQGARFFEKESFMKIGGYDPDLVGTEDLDLFNRLCNQGITPLEIKSYLYHDEGRLTLRNMSKRIIYYSKSFKKYKERHPEIAKKQFTLLRPAYFKNWRKMIKHPLLTTGFIVSKFVEGVSALYGMHLKGSWGDYKKEMGR